MAPSIYELKPVIIYVSDGAGNAVPYVPSSFAPATTSGTGTSFNGTGTGAGSPVVPDVVVANWSMQVIYTGTPDDLEVALELSLNGVQFSPVVRWNYSMMPNDSIVHVAGVPALRARANVIANTAGAGVTAIIGWSGA